MAIRPYEPALRGGSPERCEKTPRGFKRLRETDVSRYSPHPRLSAFGASLSQFARARGIYAPGEGLRQFEEAPS